VHKTLHQRAKAGLDFGVASGGEGCHGAAMKAVIHDNNGWQCHAPLIAIQTR